MTADANFCPYVGLQPFTEEDRAYFFGREREIRLVGANLYAAKLTVLYGESGVGKSSVLMAGVVPELRLRQKPRTAVVIFRDWQRPDALSILKAAVAHAGDEAAGKPLGLDAGTPLDDLLAAAGKAIGGTTLVLMDQFEEYFLYYPPGGAGDEFDAELARAVNRRDVNAGFVISIREDSLSKLDRFRARIPTVLANPLRIRHLRPGDARDAIQKPLEVYNKRPDAAAKPASIEPALVDALIEQTISGRVSLAQTGATTDTKAEGDERVEAPYLQLVLTRLWNEEGGLGSRVLRLATLKALGGASRIVRTHLDQVMSRLSPRDQALCADFFDRLVTPSGTKIACRLDDLKQWAGVGRASDVEGVVKALAAPEARILRAIDPLPGQPPQYEIFHDVLAAGVRDWQARFQEACERERLEREAAERERTEAEARALAIEREHAETARRTARHLYAFSVVVAVLFALALGAAWWAYKKQQEATAAAILAKKAQAALELEKINDAYAKKRDAKVALEELKKVFELDPGLAAAYESRGRVFLDRSLAPTNDPRDATNDINSAIAEFEQALKLNPKPAVRANTLVALAAAHQRKGDTKRALGDYDDAIKAASGDASTPPGQLAQLYLSRGTLRESLGLKDGALADYSEAIKLQPYFDDAYLARGQLYADANDREKALDDLRLAFKYANDDRTRTVAQARLSRLGAIPTTVATSQTLIYIQIVDPKNMDAASAVKRELEAQGYKVVGIEPVPKARTSGDVRYSTAAYQATAERVARVVETVLAREGYQVKLRTFELDAKKFPDAKPGVLEVWIPPLSQTALQVPSKLY